MVEKKHLIFIEIGAYVFLIIGLYLSLSFPHYVDGDINVERIVSVQLSGMGRLIQGVVLALLGTMGIVYTQVLIPKRYIYIVIYIISLTCGLIIYIFTPVAKGNLLSANTNVSDSIETSLEGIIISLRSSILVLFGGIGFLKNLLNNK